MRRKITQVMQDPSVVPKRNNVFLVTGNVLLCKKCKRRFFEYSKKDRLEMLGG